MDLGRWLRDRKDQAVRQWQDSVVLDAVSSGTKADQFRRANQGTEQTVRQRAANTYGGGFSAPVNRFKDVFNPDTEADKIKRLAVSGLFEDYNTQQNRLNELAKNDPTKRNAVTQFGTRLYGGLMEFGGKAPGAIADTYASAARTPIGKAVNYINPVTALPTYGALVNDVIQGQSLGTTYDQTTKNIQKIGTEQQDTVQDKINQSRFGQRATDNKWLAGGGAAVGNVGGQVLTTIASGGSTIPGSVLSGAQTFSQQRQAARDAGKSEDASTYIGALQGGVQAASEKVGLDKLKFPGGSNFVINTLKRFGTEGAQEGGQQFAQNLITNKTYNPNQGLTEGVLESAILGGFAGGVTGAAFDIPGAIPQTGIPAQPGGIRERIQIAKENVNSVMNGNPDALPANQVVRNPAVFDAVMDRLKYLDNPNAYTTAELNQMNQVLFDASKETGIPFLQGSRADQKQTLAQFQEMNAEALQNPQTTLRDRIRSAKERVFMTDDNRGSVQISQEPIGDVEAKIKQLNPNLDITTLNDRQKRIALANIEQQQGRTNVDTGQKMFGSKKDMAKMRRITAENIQEIENEGERVAAKMVTKARVLGEDAKYTVNRQGDPGVENYKKLAVSAIPNNPAQTTEARAWYVKNTNDYIQKVKSANSIAEIKQAAKEYLDSASAEKTFTKYDGTTQTYTANDVKKHLGSRSYNMLRGYSSAMRNAEYRPPTDFSFDEKKTTTTTTSGGTAKPKIHGGEQVPYERQGAPGLKNKDPKSMVKDFGFKGLEYGNYVKNKESNEHMAKFGDSMLDLETVLGIDMSALNSQAKLGVGFGSRGSGMALAHYEPSNKVINITKKNTVDGSLAHEYMHAIDDFLGESQRGGIYASNGRAVKPATKEAMDALMSAIKKGDGSYTRVATLPENYRNPYQSWSAVDSLLKNNGNDAQAAINTMVANYPNTRKSQIDSMVNYVMDKTGTKEVQVPTGKSEFYTLAQEQGAYWERPTEMLARAFDGYIGNKLDQAGIKNNYVAKGQRQPGLMHPNETHAKQLEPLFDNLFKAIKSDYNLPAPTQRPTADVATEPKSTVLNGNEPKITPVERKSTVVERKVTETEPKIAQQPKTVAPVESKTQADFDAELRAKSAEQLKRVNKQITTGTASKTKPFTPISQPVDNTPAIVKQVTKAKTAKPSQSVYRSESPNRYGIGQAELGSGLYAGSKDIAGRTQDGKVNTDGLYEYKVNPKAKILDSNSDTFKAIDSKASNDPSLKGLDGRAWQQRKAEIMTNLVTAQGFDGVRRGDNQIVAMSDKALTPVTKNAPTYKKPTPVDAKSYAKVFDTTEAEAKAQLNKPATVTARGKNTAKLLETMKTDKKINDAVAQAQASGKELNYYAEKVLDGDGVAIRPFDPKTHRIEAGFVVDKDGNMLGNHIKVDETGIQVNVGGKVINTESVIGNPLDWGSKGKIDKTQKGRYKFTETMNRNIDNNAPTPEIANQTKTFLWSNKVKAEANMRTELQQEFTNLNDRIKKTNKARPRGVSKEQYKEDIFATLNGDKTDAEIRKEYDAKPAEAILTYKKETRKLYDSLLTRINAERVKFGQEPITPRKDYITHLQEMNQQKGFVSEVYGTMKNSFADEGMGKTRNGVPGEIAGLTKGFKPISRYNPFLQRRTGTDSLKDPFMAVQEYLQPALYNIHMTEPAARARAIEAAFRTAEQVRNLDSKAVATEMETTLEKYKNKSSDNSKLITGFQEYANALAGKTQRLDRQVIDTSDGTAKALKGWQGLQRIGGRGTILGNLSSVLAQPLNQVVGFADAGGINYAKGIAAYMGEDSVIEKSDFIRARETEANKPLRGKGEKINDAGAIPLQAAELASVKLLWHTQHQKALGAGYKGQEAIQQADINTERLVAGRGIADKPEAYRSTVTNGLLQYTLEVNAQNKAFWQDLNTSQKVKFMVAATATNTLMAAITGYEPLPDFLKAIFQTGKDFLNEEDDRNALQKGFGGVQRMAGEYVGMNPLVGSAVNVLPKDDRKKLFGSQSEVGRYPGGNAPIQVVTNTIDAANKITKGDYKGAAESGVRNVPFGNQIRKTAGGIELLNKGYATDSNGDPTYQAPTSPLGKAQVLAFGPNSSRNAQNYYNEKEAGLTKDDLERLRDTPPEKREEYKKQLIAKNKASAKAESDKEKRLKDSGSTTSKVNAINTASKDKLDALKASLSPDDYDISNMTKAEKKQVVEAGIKTQAEMDGLENYVKNKKKELGIATSEAKDLPSNINQKARQILEDESVEDAEWLKKPNADGEITRTVSSWLPKGITAPPVNNATAKSWAELEKKRAEGTLGKLEEESTKKTILRNAYNSVLTEDEKDLYSLSEERLLDAYDRGVINDENINKALAVEKQLFDAGLISKETLAKKLGLVARGYKGRSGGRGGRGSTAKDTSQTEVNNLSLDTFSKLNQLLAGTTAKKSAPKRVVAQKAVTKKITVKA